MSTCEKCGKDYPEQDIYTVDNKKMCEDCAIQDGLFPLEHTGGRRDKISERGRVLTRPTDRPPAPNKMPGRV